MAGDLLARQLLKGKSVDEVVKLLGKPDRVGGAFMDEEVPAIAVWEFNLLNDGLWNEDMCLRVGFGSNERVVSINNLSIAYKPGLKSRLLDLWVAVISGRYFQTYESLKPKSDNVGIR